MQPTTLFTACIILSLLLTSVFAISDPNWDHGEGGRGVSVQEAATTTIPLSEDEEVVLEYDEAHEVQDATTQLRKIDDDEGGVVPPGGVTQDGSSCSFKCEFFFNNSPQRQICTGCQKEYSYSLKDVNRKSCYIYPNDFKNGQVTQSMVNTVYKFCTATNGGHCQCSEVPKVSSIGLYDKLPPSGSPRTRSRAFAQY